MTGYERALHKEKNKRKSRKRLSAGMKKLVKAAAYTVMILFAICLSIYFAYANEINAMANSVTKIEQDEDTDSEVTNILLIGTDARSAEETARSDALLLISIVPAIDTISVTSFMRDTIVTSEEYGSLKVTDLYALEGADAVCSALENLYQITISDYISIDLFNAWKIVDLLGGSRVSITLEESRNMNGLIYEINSMSGEPYGSSYMDETEEGEVHLDGKQSLAYSRIRYLDTDAVRTNRQKQVILGVLKEWGYLAKHLKIARLASIYSGLPEIGQYVRTTLTADEIKELAGIRKILAYSTYKIKTQTVPISGTWSDAWLDSGAEAVQVDDIDTNIKWLKRNTL